MFWIRMRRALITCWCFNCCRAVFTPGQGLFGFSLCPASEQAGGAAGAGRGQTQDSWPKLAKGVFHTIWRHAKQYIGVAGRGGGRLLGDRLGIGQRVVSNCIVHHLFSYTLLLLILLPLSLLLLLLLLLFSCLNKLSLSQHTGFTFPFLSPIPEREGGGWANGCVVFSCQPG